MNPVKTEKRPIMNMMYRPPKIMSSMSESFCLSIVRSRKRSTPAKASIIAAWPTSPNMTAKKKGNVISVNVVGLISRYRATPYACARRRRV